MKKLFLLILFVLIFSVSASAITTEEEISSSIQGEMSAFEQALPENVRDFLPKEIYDSDFSSLTNGEINQLDFLDYVINYLLAFLPSIIRTFSYLLILIILVSIFNLMKSSFSVDGLKNAFSLCSTLCISISVFYSVSEIVDFSIEYIKLLCGAMNSFAPVMSVLYIMSGAITSATVSNTAIMLFLSIIENFILYALSPIIKLCICFSITSSISGSIDLSGISKTIRSVFTSACTLVLSIFSFVMSYQSVLGHSADSLSLRTARFAVGNFIPVVGGFVSDSLKTVASSVSYIKNACGVVAVIVIFLLTIPIIISLMLNKLSFGMISGISKALGIENESRICDEASNICGFLLAIVSLCAIVFIFALTIFIKSSVGS